MIRRIRRQSKRAAPIVASISSAERSTLYRIYYRKGPGKERARKKLASKGMITSKVGSRAMITDIGAAALFGRIGASDEKNSLA